MPTTSFKDLSAQSLRIGGIQVAPYKPGNVWFVNPNSGNDGNGGKTWRGALATMAAAFARLHSGDTIYFVGNIREQLVAPTKVFDVSIIGAGNRPRHADTHPAGSELAASTWRLPLAGGTNSPLLTVRDAGWRVENFLMAGHASNACILLMRTSESPDAELEQNASHFEAHGIRFASGRDGVEQSGGMYNVGIFDCDFHDLTGYAIKHTAGAGIADPYRWQIKRNRVNGCANFMGVWNAHEFEVENNDITQITTLYLDFSGGSGHNIVRGNAFDVAAADFDPTGKVAGAATDVWSNTLLDAIETGVPAD